MLRAVRMFIILEIAHGLVIPTPESFLHVKNPPRITWDDQLAEALWNHPLLVPNKENWPIIHVKRAFRGHKLEKALARVSLLSKSEAAMPLVQTDGSTSIRKSRLVNLSPRGVPARLYGSGDATQHLRSKDRAAANGLRESILAVLPRDLGLTSDNQVHPFEDSSLVLYDDSSVLATSELKAQNVYVYIFLKNDFVRGGQDFYAEHHDSWWPGGKKYDAQVGT